MDLRATRDLRRPLALTLALAAAAAPPALAQRSYAMRFECRTAEPNTPAGRRRAEEWVRDKLKGFVPSPEQALRMRTLELEAEQVKLAFYGISSTCEQYLSGRMRGTTPTTRCTVSSRRSPTSCTTWAATSSPWPTGPKWPTSTRSASR